MESAKTYSIQDAQYSKPVSDHWIDRIAERTVHKLLQRLETGRLSLHDGEQTFEYGDPNAPQELHAVIHVHHASLYRRVLLNGSTGSGEAFMTGAWSSPDLVAVVRVMVANMETLQSMDQQGNPLRRLLSAIYRKATANSLSGSKENISAHYDLSNELFSLFLDQNMMYSSAIFPTPETDLEQAAEYKLHHICERLQLSEQDHLLEIGTGWGGMAIYAAKHFGCRVTTTTISQEQYRYASEWVKREGLEDRITLLLKDYRKLEGQYDKLVSVEMIEAVGHEYYPTFFKQCNNLIKPDGLMLIQAITIADQRYQQALRSVDFIQKYIFPGGSLPSASVIADNLCQHTDMQLVGLEDITLDYAETLRCWRERFFARLDEVKRANFDDTFIRMWDFYLCYCEGGFRERVISTGQFLIAKPGCRQLPSVG
ncbi:cyclopropane-fatty-acyl-phospholipid synthase family protein [Aestuariirhabdus sp. Z084]|uniref:SAM-dependent methyltransferase n=1 Tax=Aestuariirhabdus haliotis TaxID=2918751 RepID=UPI00201B3B76|nr:cyclopropane-fatty-acyl-phospholipid synthase family protein [Aestuariirhabdus haliotis]MCL6416038.1 cyclopropane-fatty-acyl-phospholipid synthase family protein [Aestuariirhabdus haliotis]MCL6419394.1 cyclopropane-fatty-acyl-phospholipid synthase family protein [Aestuariirhabdus haliotis]